MAKCIHCGGDSDLIYYAGSPICLVCDQKRYPPTKPKPPASETARAAEKMAPDTKEQVREQLIQELAEATEMARKASDAFCSVMGDIPSGLPYPDSTHRIHNASRELSRARDKVLQAQIRLHNFVMDQIVPHRDRSEIAK